MDPRFPTMNAFAPGSHSEIINIPDRMVGLIIGKGGEQINAIQAESDCKIQFAPADNSGMAERPCTLTGTPEAIVKARELIFRIMHKGHDMPGGGGGGGMGGSANNLSVAGMVDGAAGQHMIEMMIPGNKAGIIIGKGGDTIKQLQERACVRMVIIQESNSPTSHDKPLRITGDPQSCHRAKEMVIQLLQEKDIMSTGSGSEGFGEYGRTNFEMEVPRSTIGIVIGKGGEMIKKIQQESGARIQFKPEDEMGGPNRICCIMGSQDQTRTAANMIHEIVENAMQRQGGMGGGDSVGWGGAKSARGPSDGNRARFGNGVTDETTYSVPADKCGLVIGKGGETIREICRQSGAHVELNRDASANSMERIFRIQGSQEQIRQAIQLVCEKAGITPPRDGGAVAMPNVPAGVAVASMMNAQPAVASIYGQATSQAAAQQPMQQFALQPAQYQYQPYSQPAAAITNDIQTMGKQGVDANAAAWAAYYAQYYNQLQSIAAAQQQQQPAVSAALQAALQQQPQQQSQQYGTLLPRTTVTPQPSLAGLQQQPIATSSAGAAPDYTAAWADYYRSQGLHQQAHAILMQSALQPQQ